MLARYAFALAILAACGGKTDEPPVATRVIGTDKGDPNDPTSGRDPIPDGGQLLVSEGGTLNACGSYVAAFTTDFESGNLADHFTVKAPSGLSTVTAGAIDGAHSLQFDPAGGNASLAHKVSGACKVTLTFAVSLSPHVIASGVKLAQVNAQNHFFAVIVTAGGGIGLAQTAFLTATGDSATIQANPFMTLVADTAYRVSFVVDVAAKSVTVSVASTTGGGIQTLPNSYMSGDAVAIGEVDFGAAPDETGPSPVPNGTWLLDDVTLQ